MSLVTREQLGRYLRGELDEAQTQAIEFALATDPATGALADRLAHEASGDADDPGNPFRSPEVDPGSPSARAIAGAAAHLDRRRRARVVGVVLAASLLLALGSWASLRTGPPAFGAEACAAARAGGPLPLLPSLDCGLTPDINLGRAAPTEVTALRLELDAAPRRDAVDWLQARALVSLLEGRPSEVVALLDGSPALAAEPRLYADLATAWWMLDDLTSARAALAQGLSLRPNDPVLLRNRLLLGP